jgi:hypothetical protein
MEVENKVLTNEVRQKLASTGMLGFTENPEFIYTPEAFREKKEDSDEYAIPKELWPVFTLKGKDGVESAKMEDNMGYMEIDNKSKNQRWIGKSGSRRVEILQVGIIGWKNWYDTDGNLIPFRHNNGKVHTDCLKRIPVGLAIELANAITDRITLSPEELEGLES